MRRRVSTALAVGLGTWAMALAGTAAAAPALQVVARGLDNPRNLAVGPDGTIYVASAGHAGKRCLDRKRQNCVGLTSRVIAVSPAGAQRTIATGLLSAGAANGTFTTGVDGVAVDPSGRVFVVTTSGTPKDIRSAPKALGALAGKLSEVTGGIVKPLAAIDAYEWAHNVDGVKGDRNSNPYAVLALPDRRIVADAGANAIYTVDDTGTVTPLFVLPKNRGQAVPTSLALGPDHAVYVGQLAEAAGKGKAVVWRVPLDGSAPSIAASGFTMITGVGVGADGSLYVTQLTTNPKKLSPHGLLTKVAPDGTRTNVSKGLSFPAGLAIDRQGAVYVSNFSILPAHTPRKSDFKGAGGQLVKITGL